MSLKVLGGTTVSQICEFAEFEADGAVKELPGTLLTVKAFALELLEGFIKRDDCLIALFAFETVDMSNDPLAE